MCPFKEELNLMIGVSVLFRLQPCYVRVMKMLKRLWLIWYELIETVFNLVLLTDININYDILLS